jgi:phosphatidate cytidylyltransferase
MTDEVRGLNKNATKMLTGFIFGTITMGCIMYGGLALLLLLGCVLFFGSKEYVKVLEHKGFHPSLKIICATEIILALMMYFDRQEYVASALVLFTFASFMWVLFRGRQPYIANVATTVLGFIYCGYFPLHLLLLRNISSPVYNDGLGFVVMMFTAVVLTDVGCYYAGTKFGKHKLAPVISPNKTIEGSIGGMICAIIGAMTIGWFISMWFAPVPWYISLSAGLSCTVFGQIGDLSESLIKRDAGVKDSGDSLPGHGGFLDRTDSYIFAIPVMYYFCKYFVFSNDVINYIKGLF